MPAAKGFRPPNAGKGRKAGVPNKLTATLKEAILQALDRAGGVDYLVGLAKDNPTAFATLLGRVLPMTIGAENLKKLVLEWQATSSE